MKENEEKIMEKTKCILIVLKQINNLKIMAQQIFKKKNITGPVRKRKKQKQGNKKEKKKYKEG